MAVPLPAQAKIEEHRVEQREVGGVGHQADVQQRVVRSSPFTRSQTRLPMDGRRDGSTATFSQDRYPLSVWSDPACHRQ